jgi:pimeloyl-ACP methyl ester carboxylesterase
VVCPPRASRLVLALALFALAWIAPARDAEAGNRKASCGGLNQTPCRLLFPDFMSPSCDTTIPWLYENFAQDLCLALGCGGVNQPACTVTQHIPSCNPGSVELIGPNGAYCRTIDGDGYPTVCGGLNERACLITEHIPSCKPGLGEVPFPGGTCIQLDADGFPPFCGGANEPACLANEHLPSCKPGLSEVPFPGGTCIELDAQGFPPFCGDAGERACLVTEHALASCKPSAFEVATPNLPLGLNGRCVRDEDFSTAPFSTSRPAAQAPPGPRSIFLVHGLGGDKNSLKLDALHDPARGLVRHWFDYNASGANPSYVARVLRGDGSLACERGEQIDGYAFSLPEASNLLREMLLDPSCRDQSSGPTPRDAQGIENVTLIAHSMGGLVVRDLVARHYDALLAAGVRIAEVITAGSPHRGGGGALPETWDAQSAMCAIPANAVGSFGLAVHQSCLIERWFAALRNERVRRDAGGAPFIDNQDFPGIRWIAIAAADSDVVPSLLSFGTLVWGANAAARHDGLVAHASAFGLSADFCFPNVDAAPPSPAIPLRDPHSNAWFEHFWPVDLSLSPLRFASPWGSYSQAHGYDLTPSAVVTLSPSVLGQGSLYATCHSPGPDAATPDRSYLFDAQTGRFRLPGVANPHGDIVDTDAPSLHRGGIAVMHYLKTLLTNGLRGPDVNGDGNEDAADRAHVLAAMAAGPISAEDAGFDVWSDLDGDGFLTAADLQAGGLTDADGDAVLDSADNCPHAANLDQLDRGGIGAASAPDGIGDACQCGDVSGDGKLSSGDAILISRALLVPPTATLARPELCNVAGSAACSTADAVTVVRALLVPPTAVVAQVCAPALP